VRDSISAVARVSMPYRMAGRKGVRSSSHNTRHGPTPRTHNAATADPRALRPSSRADVAHLAPPGPSASISAIRAAETHGVGDGLRAMTIRRIDEDALVLPVRCRYRAEVHAAFRRAAAGRSPWRAAWRPALVHGDDVLVARTGRVAAAPQVLGLGLSQCACCWRSPCGRADRPGIAVVVACVPQHSSELRGDSTFGPLSRNDTNAWP